MNQKISEFLKTPNGKLAAAVSALVELYTPNGMDTFTCPMAAMAVLLPLVALFGGSL